MRNTVVLEVKGTFLSFWPFEQNMGNTSVPLRWWPKALTRRMQRPGIYVIRRLSGARGGIATKIHGRHINYFYPATWYQDYGCSICARLLVHWGINIPRESIRTYYFKVTRLA